MSPNRRFRRLALALVLFVGLAIAALFALDTLAFRFDVGGIRYPEQVMAYRTQAVEPRWQRADGSLDLDGMLFRQRPGLDLDLGSHRLSTNALGLRGPEIALPKPTGHYRVLMIGDSVVYGWGVDDADTFVRRLEVEWNGRGDWRTYEIINAGHLVYDTVQQLALLRELGPVVQPDFVVLVYVVNDVEPTRDLVEDHLGLPREPDPMVESGAPEPSWLADAAANIHPIWPHLAALLRLEAQRSERYGALLERHGGRWIPEEHGAGPRGWERSRAALLDMSATCDSWGVPFLVLDHSFPPVPSLELLCREHGIDWADFRFTGAEQGLDIRNSRSDSHANSEGHRLLLEKLRAALAARGLPPD
ncbi:MAG: hypothetical protein GC161_11555 [Planctomycetaceae bacterium]|nr:hypothetical protein [Planctomycetaceae bacterium]